MEDVRVGRNLVPDIQCHQKYVVQTQSDGPGVRLSGFCRTCEESDHRVGPRQALNGYGSFGGDIRFTARYQRRERIGALAGDPLSLGGTAILETMLHEAAHALACVRGVKDCSRSGNRYHNRRFAQLAEELGLMPPGRPLADRGYSRCTLEAATAATYRTTIENLNAGVVAHLEQPDKQTRAGRAGRRVAVVCTCGRRLQITPRTYEDGPIVCGRCDSVFRSL